MLGFGQFFEKCSASKCPSTGAHLAGSDFSIFVASRDGHIEGHLIDGIFFGLQSFRVFGHHFALDFDVSVVDFTEKCFPWRKNIKIEESNTRRIDCLCLHFCLHQPARSKASTKNGYFLCCHVSGELSSSRPVDGGHLA